MSLVICSGKTHPECDPECPHNRPHEVMPANATEWCGLEKCDVLDYCAPVDMYVMCVPVLGTRLS